jgi:NitT/TauT family transport system permease protein
MTNLRPDSGNASSFSWLLPVAVLLMIVGLWQVLIAFLVQVRGLNAALFPVPKAVLEAGWLMRNDLCLATLRTAAAALAGLSASIVIGIAIAFVFSQSSIVRRAFYPYAVLLQTIPIIAIAPIVILTLGRGFQSIALVSCIISLFPIITNTTTGLLQIDSDLVDLFRLNRATRWQLLVKLRMPSSLPYLISGIRIASGLAIVGAIVGEFFLSAGPTGLGSLIQGKVASFNMAELYAVVIIATLLGTFVFGLITMLGDWVLQRWFGMSLDGQ